MEFKSQSSQSWIDYMANVGGLLGLCIGLSIVTVIEIIWLCVRLTIRLMPPGIWSLRPPTTDPRVTVGDSDTAKKLAWN